MSFLVHKFYVTLSSLFHVCGKNVLAKNTCTYLRSHKSAQILLCNALYIKPALRYHQHNKD